MIDRNTEAPNDAKPVLCAGAVSKDGITLIHGDSLQACHQMRRKLIGYEIDAEYYQKACKRFEEETRQTALW